MYILDYYKRNLEFIQSTYSKARDTAHVYEIKVKTETTMKGDISVTKYANLLQNLWQELDHYRVTKMKCPDDTGILNNLLKKIRYMIFPSLEETIQLIQAEKSQRSAMLEPQTVDGSAMV